MLYYSGEIENAFVSADRTMFSSEVSKALDELLEHMISNDYDGELIYCSPEQLDDFRKKLDDKPEYKAHLYMDISKQLYSSYEKMAESEQTAHKIGLPFDRHHPDLDEDDNPYAYDPSRMSIEDYELMHKLRQEDSEGNEPEM